MLPKWRGKWYLFDETAYFISFLMIKKTAKKMGVFFVKPHKISIFM